jgi:hypothetical protein
MSKKSISIKIENGHITELKERNTMEQFSTLSTAWLKNYPSVSR